jgi:hypothetical protein
MFYALTNIWQWAGLCRLMKDKLLSVGTATLADFESDLSSELALLIRNREGTNDKRQIQY